MELVVGNIQAQGLDLTLALKTFINVDMTVDGEVRIGELPELWRTEEGLTDLMAFLSRVLKAAGTLVPGDEGGRYWISVGVRFGPQTDAERGDLAEMYKRYRGMFQVASYSLDLGMKGGIMNAIIAFEMIVKSLMEKRGIPPAVVFVRYTWTPDGTRPGRYDMEKGGGR